MFRHILALLGAILAMAVLTAGTASASVPRVDTDAVLKADSRAALGSGATKQLISQRIAKSAQGTAGVAATTCTVNYSSPVKAGTSEVAADYSVSCDQEVTGIAGFVAIFRVNESAPLGNTVDQFNFGTLGGGEQIKRPCASGNLYTALRVVVVFKTGEPKMIDRTFFSPVSRVSC
ncbi:hypothetical protein ACFQ05_31545 [Amycolatopsis umgeniensis]|uniref:Uncharacterized protein n=1 Tax=Amycolatopsis umgeniensis TaxID=336628 RepID=A0A841BFE2_9PSEU|nr:hypothetical protein [Amycolatopsis umgeniensis]MBB5857443.1 hypothetical protein [Amycolatopsis umgeniensis]